MGFQSWQLLDFIPPRSQFRESQWMFQASVVGCHMSDHMMYSIFFSLPAIHWALDTTISFYSTAVAWFSHDSNHLGRDMSLCLGMVKKDTVLHCAPLSKQSQRRMARLPMSGKGCFRFLLLASPHLPRLPVSDIKLSSESTHFHLLRLCIPSRFSCP